MSALKKIQKDHEKARLVWQGKEVELSVVTGTEGENAVDVESLRAQTGLVTLDRGYGNTASCFSSITFLDGENGILRYRGYDIADLADHFDFDAVCYLLIYGALPDGSQLKEFNHRNKQAFKLPKRLQEAIRAIPAGIHPMAALSSLTLLLTAEYPEFNVADPSPETIDKAMHVAMGAVTTMAGMLQRTRTNQNPAPVKGDAGLSAHFHEQFFGKPATRTALEALNKLFILHADHEQNCSTSTVRMVGSSKAPLFAALSAGISALWGPLHGGANQAVLEMLEQIHTSGEDMRRVIARAKDKNDNFRLMGFGHRVYKNFDPRAQIIKKACDQILKEMDRQDPLLEIARRLEEAALSDSYFVERKLYPNVDFYSGIIYRALGIPVDMFTVMFAVGRLPGWLAHWKEMINGSDMRIGRPRQIYQGQTVRKP